MSGDLISRSALLEEFEWLKSQVSACSVCEVEEHMERIRNAPAVEAEPVVHAHWEDEYGGKYANPRYRCSACKARALWKSVQDELLSWHEVQALTERCPHCGAHMDEEVANES